MAITIGVLSLLYAAIQGYRFDKKNRLVETVGEERREVEL